MSNDLKLEVISKISSEKLSENDLKTIIDCINNLKKEEIKKVTYGDGEVKFTSWDNAFQCNFKDGKCVWLSDKDKPFLYSINANFTKYSYFNFRDNECDIWLTFNENNLVKFWQTFPNKCTFIWAINLEGSCFKYCDEKNKDVAGLKLLQDTFYYKIDENTYETKIKFNYLSTTLDKFPFEKVYEFASLELKDFYSKCFKQMYC